MSWNQLGALAPTSLGPARVEAHWAAQVVAAVGAAVVPRADDDSHTSLAVRDGLLIGQPFGDERWIAALRFEDLAVVVCDARGAVVDVIETIGRPLDAVLVEVGARVSARTSCGAVALARPTYDLPENAVAAGAPFTGASREARAELARWFEAASATLGQVAAREAGASAVRLWPHHFDLATLITAKAGEHGESAKTVGVGLSPGDASYKEPYVYVTPWPYPAPAALPALATPGRWHTEGWVGAVVLGTDIVGAAPSARAACVEGFLHDAVGAARSIHARPR